MLPRERVPLFFRKYFAESELDPPTADHTISQLRQWL